ncbi:MAG TPA: hypothetical protein VFO62_10270 [Candidatus Binatia bacterium]|nr:hypothetical protein [Candidatus Binatia bacterium]
MAALFVPMALWHWPRLIVRDLAIGFRSGWNGQRSNRIPARDGSGRILGYRESDRR